MEFKPLAFEETDNSQLLHELARLSAAELQTRPEADFVRALTQRWLSTINHRTGENPEKVTAALYTLEGILVGTVAEEIYKGRPKIQEYFKHFFELEGLWGEISTEHESYVQLFRTSPRIAINSGMYIFYWIEGDIEVPHLARFTFVYEQQENGIWLIVNHHSSLQPETEKA